MELHLSKLKATFSGHAAMSKNDLRNIYPAHTQDFTELTGIKGA